MLDQVIIAGEAVVAFARASFGRTVEVASLMCRSVVSTHIRLAREVLRCLARLLWVTIWMRTAGFGFLVGGQITLVGGDWLRDDPAELSDSVDEVWRDSLPLSLDQWTMTAFAGIRRASGIATCVVLLLVGINGMETGLW
jgi:hypothetical protein